jgi:ribulose-5-phosphate 4-epimerase/fuculose-1-phosphate aldolase
MSGLSRLPLRTDAQRDLAAAWRILAHFGLIDTVFNHASIAVESSVGGEPSYVMNRFGSMPKLMRSADVVEIVRGAVCGDAGVVVNPDGLALHGAIQGRRVGRPTAIIHLHPESCIAVGVSHTGLLPISQTAMEFVEEVQYLPYDGLLHTLIDQEGSIADGMAAGAVAFLRSHGMLVVADSIGEAVYCAYYLEEACRHQLLALRSGRREDLLLPEAAVATATGRALRKTRKEVSAVFWNAALALVGDVNP